MTFDHRDPGTPEPGWMASERWAPVPWSDARGFGRALVIAAHPDDETLGAGALLARLHRAGTRVTVVLATRGEGAYSVDTSLRRLGEFHAAIARLAPECSVVDLGLPDGRLHEHERVLERALRVVGRTDVVLAPWRGDEHSDHRVAGDAGARVAAAAGAVLLEYPIWLWHWATPDHPAVPWSEFVRVPQAGPDRRAKEAALAAYASQAHPESLAGSRPDEAPILHAGMLAHFAREWETFVRSNP